MVNATNMKFTHLFDMVCLVEQVFSVLRLILYAFASFEMLHSVISLSNYENVSVMHFNLDSGLSLKQL